MADTPFSGVSTNAGVNLGSLNPVFAARMQNLIQAAEAATGAQVQITSGYRSPEKQAQIYADYTRKPVSYGGKTYTPKGPSGIIAAKPGSSEHQSGTAMDISPNGAAYQWMVKNAPKYGIQSLATVNGKSYDAPHFQLTRSDMTQALAGKLPMPPGMNVPEVGTALAYTGATPPLPRTDPRSALGAIGNATQPSLANWFANGPDRAQVSPASTDVASLYNGILPPQGAQFGGEAGLALGMNPALEAEAQAATNPTKFGVTQTFQNGLPVYSLPPQPNSSGSPDNRNQSLSAILAQAASGNTVPSQSYPQAATANTVPSVPAPVAATGNTLRSINASAGALGAVSGGGVGSGTASLPSTVPLPRPDPRVFAAGSSSGGVSTAPAAAGSARLPQTPKQLLNAQPAQPTGQTIPDPTLSNTPYSVYYPPANTVLGGASKMTPPAALQGVANALGGVSNYLSGNGNANVMSPSGSATGGVSIAPSANGMAHLISSSGSSSGGVSSGGAANGLDSLAPVGDRAQQLGNTNSWSDLLTSFNSPTGTSSVAMNDPSGANNTRVSHTIMVPVQTLNPAYTEWMNNQANINKPGISASGQALGMVGANGVASGAISLGKPNGATAAPPKYITVQQQHTVYSTPPQGVVQQPVVQPMTAINQFRAANPTASPSQAYNTVGAQAIQQAQQPNGPVYASVTGNSGSYINHIA